MKDKIITLLEHLSAYEKLRGFKKSASGMFGDDEEKKKKDKEEGTPVLEGISFRFKTVQFHMIDDIFQEIKKREDIFGDVEIYSESFSLPGWGEETQELSRDDFQFKITALIKTKTDKETYFKTLEEIMTEIEKKYNVNILVEPTEEYYNVNYITIYTSREDVFSKK